MISYTLDTNCIIDVDEGRPSGEFVKKLLNVSTTGRVDLALVASSASERQTAGDYLSSFASFDQRRKLLGFGDLPILPVIARWGVSFWGTGVWSGPELEAREQAIFNALFPNHDYDWEISATKNCTEASDTTTAAYAKWRNQILDAQAFWAHDFANRRVFVTSDKNFQKKLVGHQSFPKAMVMTPKEAVCDLDSLL